MSTLFDDLQEALGEAIAHTRGEPTGVRVRELPAIEVAETRRRLGLSQAEFATVFNVSIGTIRNWEQRRREPEGPARVLLTVIGREPEAVVRALRLERNTPGGPTAETHPPGVPAARRRVLLRAGSTG